LRLGRPQLAAFATAPRHLIVLRDAEGALLNYRASRDVARLRDDVAAHNAFLAGVAIGVAHPEVSRDEHGFLVVGDQWLNPYRTAYYRVFNRNFSCGGRWFGPFWQGLPSRVRAGLTLDGAATVELDFRACHLRLLAALVGSALPFDNPTFDAYAIPGWPRAQVKLAFNIMLNADSVPVGRGALAQHLRHARVPHPQRAAGALMAAIIAHFPGFEAFWNTGIGLRLQNRDATICARVQRRLRTAGIPCLSVHDSFIVPASARSELNTVMDQEMDKMCQRIRQRTS
jgi:hypothetical protein